MKTPSSKPSASATPSGSDRTLPAAASAHAEEPQPLRGPDDFLAPFVSACKPRDRWRIGPEMERFGVFEATGAPIPYEGDRSILRIFAALTGQHGWIAEREHETAPVVALERDNRAITLEPGCQLELSGAQAVSVHDVCTELRAHLREVGAISAPLGIRWLGVGFHPFAARQDFQWVPKQRYRTMREYLPTRGGHAIDMMLRTCTVQVNLDYASEADAMRKMRVALALAPTTTAMFANSPWKEGKPHGGLTYRGRIWLDVDPDRTGLVPSLWKRDARFEDYVEWALDVPMFLFMRGGHARYNTGQTFRDFWKNGFEGERPTLQDWTTHLNTLFPEVRLKKTIEVRGADVQSRDLACALPAIWTGVFYDDRALAEAEALVEGWSYEEVAELRPRVWREGLRTPFRGRPLAEVAQRLVAIAQGGLERRGIVEPSSGRDERVHLTRIGALVESARTPADVLLEGMDRVADPVRAILDRTTLRWD